MQILHCARKFYPSLGGVETHLQKIIEYGYQKGENWIVLTDQQNKKDSLREKKPWGSIIRIPLWAQKNKFARWKWIVSHSHLFKSADVVQMHDVWWWIVPIWLSIRHKLCTTFHGWEGRYPISKKAILHRRLASLLSKKVMHVGSWISEFYGDFPDSITFGGVDSVSNVVKNKKETNSKTNKTLSIVFFGRLEPVNEIDLYIQFFESLKKLISCEIIWVGDGSMAPKAKNIGKVTGMVSNPAKYLDNADVVCANSYLSLLEAQAHGKIVVSLYSNKLKKSYLETYPGYSSLISNSSPFEAASDLRAVLANDEKWLSIQKSGMEIAQNNSWQKLVITYRSMWDSLGFAPLVIHSAQTLGMGGAESFNAALLSELKNKFPVLAISNYKPYLLDLGNKSVEFQKNPFVIDIIGDWKGFVKGLFWLPLAIIWYQRLLVKNYSVVVVMLSGFSEKLILTPLAKIHGKRVVWIEFAPLDSLKQKFFGIPFFLYKKASKSCDKLIVPTNYTKDKLLPLISFPDSKTEVIACGSSLQPVQKVTVEKSAHIICVSRLEAGKGQEELLVAFSKLLKKLPKARLTIVGEGDQLELLTSLAKALKINKEVTFAGYVSSVVSELLSARVVVFPSYWNLEGFGMVQIEAFACGKPVVAYDIGPANEIVENGVTGLLVPVHDTTALSKALVKMCSDDGLTKKLGTNALKNFKNNYMIDKIASKYDQSIRNL